MNGGGRGAGAGGSSRWLRAFGPAVVCTVALFVGGSARLPRTGPAGSDKVLHLLGFFVLCLAYFHGLSSVTRSPRRALVLAGVAAVAAGGLLELWQALLPHRTADFVDWIADSVGAIACGALIAGYRWVRALGRAAERS